MFKSQSFGLPRFSGENVAMTDKIDCFVLYAMTLFIKKVRQCLIHQFLCAAVHFLGYPVMGNWLARVLWKSVKKIALQFLAYLYIYTPLEGVAEKTGARFFWRGLWSEGETSPS